MSPALDYWTSSERPSGASSFALLPSSRASSHNIILLIRDAWKGVEGLSKEEARDKYVKKLIEVRLFRSAGRKASVGNILVK